MAEPKNTGPASLEAFVDLMRKLVIVPKAEVLAEEKKHADRVKEIKQAPNTD